MMKKIKLICIFMIIVFLFFGCSTAQNKETPINTSVNTENKQSLYNYDLLYEYKNISFNDKNKITELISNLQYGKELKLSNLDFFADRLLIRIDYFMNLSKGEIFNINNTKIMQDTIILFALFDNMKEVDIEFVQGNYEFGGAITREKAMGFIGADFNNIKNKNDFKNVVDKIGTVSYNPDVMSKIPYEHVARDDE